jgi:transposase-like protein
MVLFDNIIQIFNLMDETYIKVKGEWGYLYRAVDSHGDTLDFMLSEHRNEEAATAFFKQAINNNGFPDERLVFRHNYPAKAINCL